MAIILAGPASVKPSGDEYVSGHHLFVDGGQHAQTPNYADMFSGKLDFQAVDRR